MKFLKKKKINNNLYRIMLMIFTTRNLKAERLMHLYFIVNRTIVTI
jgi:hypothetical protein